MAAAAIVSGPRLVAVLNVTPDSFFDGGQLADLRAVVARGQQCAAEGADLLDLGGESTRPGASEITVQEELQRVVPAVAALVQSQPLPVWVDTRRASVAAAALAAGAAGINDVSGFADPDMARVVAAAGVPWVLMHMPHAVGHMRASAAVETMPEALHLGVARVIADLGEAVERAVSAGASRSQLIIDPGVGFGKTSMQNAALCAVPPALLGLGLPVYVGPSRKSFLAALGRNPSQPPADRQWGTAAAVTAAVLGGAQYVRVHDVSAMRQVIDIAAAIRATRQPTDGLPDAGRHQNIGRSATTC